MSKVKRGWITFISLISALFLALGFVIGLPRVTVHAANKYTPDHMFKSVGSRSSVIASTACGDDDIKSSDPAYVLFTFVDGGNVEYRRDLALKWYAKVEKEKEGATDKTDTEEKVEVQYFSMRFSFANVVFEKFTISFESAEENISKDGKTTNTLVFAPYVEKTPDTPDTPDEGEENGAAEDEDEGNETPKEEAKPQLLTVTVNPKEDDEETADEPILLDASKDIIISIDEADCEIGEFNVWIESAEPELPKKDNEEENKKDNENDAAGAALVEEGAKVLAGKFVNVGGYFLDYRSAGSTTPNTPIIFAADIPAVDDKAPTQYVLMKSLNKQSMKLDEGRVIDNAPAVLVLNESVYAFKLGQKFSLSYQAIDVCDDNATADRYYYMLKTEDVDGEPVNFMPNEKDLTDQKPVDGIPEEDQILIKYSKYNYQRLTTSTYFLPSRDSATTDKPVEYVSIRFKMDDDTDENDYYVDLSWYAADNAYEDIECFGYKEEKTKDEDGKETTEIVKYKDTFRFIKVNRNDKGPEFTFMTVEGGKNVVDADAKKAAEDAYKADLAKAADNTSAGTGAYIYLPSLRGLIASENAGYRNLRFSIYYYKPGATSASSQTSLSYNALKLEVDKEGWYRMRIIAQDASSNVMKYYLDDQLVSVTSSNVWDIDEIPEFEFYIHYDGPSIEDPEEQSLGYRNDTYNFSDFKIIALSGYQKNYTLYRYSEVNVPETVSVPSSYADFVKNAEEYFKAFAASDEQQEDKSNKILYEISVFQDDVSADDEAKWSRTDNDYYWNPDSSLSFVPQLSGYYILKVVVEDGNYPGETAEKYMVIDVRNPIDTIPGQSQWLQENVVSVVLFAISGVLAIVVIVLFLVKPSDKKVEEVDLEKLKGKKKKKK